MQEIGAGRWCRELLPEWSSEGGFEEADGARSCGGSLLDAPAWPDHNGIRA